MLLPLALHDSQNYSIERFYQDKLDDLLRPNRVVVIYGPRRVGKTTLIHKFLTQRQTKTQEKIFTGNGDDAELQQVLQSRKFSQIIPFFENYDLIFIDEAQMIDNIGLALKIIVDQIPGIRVIVTGSSSFSLSNKLGEPLVGRQRILKLFSISALEIKNNEGYFQVIQELDNMLIFGSYPEVMTACNFAEKQIYLQQIRDSYLYKDILQLENIRNSRKILDLLQLIAYQIGQEVSLHELGKQLGMSKNTVAKYLDLLEKAFVLINVRGFSRNLRKEITKTSRYYFYDNGVRNAVINNFNLLSSRDDVGQLWENFLFMERLKKRSYQEIGANYYFWRTYDQQEIDLVEERGGKLYGYEFKWGKNKVKAPKIWKKTYSQAEFTVINKQNFLEFVG